MKVYNQQIGKIQKFVDEIKQHLMKNDPRSMNMFYPIMMLEFYKKFGYRTGYTINKKWELIEEKIDWNKVEIDKITNKIKIGGGEF